MATVPTFRQRLFRNIGWQAVSVIVRALVSILTLAVLARIAGPGTMGIYGLAWVGPAIAFPLLQAGVGQSLFLIKELRPGHASAAFGITLGIAFVAAALVIAAGPVIAQVLRVPALTYAYWGAATFIPLMAIGVVDMSLTQRNFDFRKVAAAHTASIISSSLLSILIASVFDPLIGLFAFQGTIGLFQFLYFRLGGRKIVGVNASRSEYADVWERGRHLAANSVSASILVNFPQLVLGSLLTVDQLGMYTLSRAGPVSHVCLAAEPGRRQSRDLFHDVSDLGHGRHAPAARFHRIAPQRTLFVRRQPVDECRRDTAVLGHYADGSVHRPEPVRRHAGSRRRILGVEMESRVHGVAAGPASGSG